MTFRNVDPATVAGFGDEWRRFDQSRLSERELSELFNRYFSVFPWETLPPRPVGVDLGCGSGRWARFVAPRVGELTCVDASREALEVARRSLAKHENVVFLDAAAGELPLPDRSFDFVYSIGVLHHTPDPVAAFHDCARLLKPGGLLLVYLYYAFDDRPSWFRAVWRASDLLRRALSRLPEPMRYAVSQLLAALVYWPLARTSRFLEHHVRDVTTFPLSYYRDQPFYVMRNDALDRFGTRVEHRFRKEEIEALFHDAGLIEVQFREAMPRWCAVGRRPSS